MNNRFFVYIELLISFICLFATDILGLVIGVAVAGLPDNRHVAALCMSVFAFISFVLIVCLLCSCEVIEISEDGIAKSLFRKRIKYFKWEEITEVKGNGNIAAPSVAFFKNRNENSFLYRFVKKEKIFFAGSIKKTEILKHYAPEFILKKIFSKDNEYADDTALLKCDSATLPSKNVTVNNKFYACFYVIPIAVLIFVLCVGGFFIGVAIAGFPKPLFLLVIMIIILIALPSALLILGISVGLRMIEITEQGIALLLFGKRLKYFKWEEISKTKIQREGKGDKLSITFYRNKKDSKRNRKERISFTYAGTDISKVMILKHYAPEYIMDKLKSNGN